jgi:hypothetical protein
LTWSSSSPWASAARRRYCSLPPHLHSDDGAYSEKYKAKKRIILNVESFVILERNATDLVILVALRLSGEALVLKVGIHLLGRLRLNELPAALCAAAANA